jgi:hypothetical protein
VFHSLWNLGGGSSESDSETSINYDHFQKTITQKYYRHDIDRSHSNIKLFNGLLRLY